ncbi:hypothetical protein GCM10027062_45600 [Nocardioides hungaricus]
MAVERVLLDTNVLLAAVDDSRRRHAAAIELIGGDPRALAVTTQVMQEFLAVSTRPVAVNGLGQSGHVAVANLEEMASGLDVLVETPESLRRLKSLVREGLASGRQVHDANLVAVALAHEVDAIVTDNLADFARFAELIEIESLTP